MNPQVLSVNVARSQPDPGGQERVSGIDKRPVPSIEVFTPAPGYGNGSGVVGDTVGDSKHHGGADKAIYAFSREQLDHWEREIGHGLVDGQFGENLTTSGLDVEALLINQRLRIGDEVVLEVSIPRQPCRTFAAWMEESAWVRRFTEHGRCGAYLRVAVPGTIRTGDPIELLEPPAHDVDMHTAFAAAMGDDTAAQRVVDAACLPAKYHDRLVERLAKRA